MLGGVNSWFPPGNEIDARFRRFSKDDEADGALTAGLAPKGVPSRLENFSRALIRLEIPEETLIFLAMRTGVVGRLSEWELETDRPTARACIPDDAPIENGLETARKFFQA